MSLNFGLMRSPEKVLFGSGQLAALPRLVAEFGTRALVCTDERLAGSDIFATAMQGLRDAGIEVAVFSGTEPELPVSGIFACADAHADFAPSVIIGFGGGSCMDLAKLVGIVLSGQRDLSQVYGEFKVTTPPVPVIAIPTTSGTGSEVTPVAVLGDKDRDLKVGVADPALIPRVAICDPDLTLTCPPGLTAVSGIDALAHAIEAFTATRHEATPDLALERVFVGKNALSDHNALTAIKLIFDHLPTAVARGDDAEARAGVMLGSTLAGLAFGSGGTSAAHAIQYPIGALTGTAHGMGVGILLPHAMRHNRDAALADFAAIARAIGRATDKTPEAEAADAAIQAVQDLAQQIGMPAGLADIGVPEDRLGWIAERSLDAARLAKNNPRPLTVDGVREILDAAMHGADHTSGKDFANA